MVKDITSRAKGWTQRKNAGKSEEKGKLLVLTSGSHLKLSLRQVSPNNSPQVACGPLEGFVWPSFVFLL